MPASSRKERIMSEEKKIDDIIAMIDNFMAGGGGHMNIDGGGVNSDNVKKVVTTNSLECASGNMACKVPTLHEGLDSEE